MAGAVADTAANKGGKPKAVALLGPTAAGKTDLVLSLAEELPLHLISVDSVMVYRSMDIGSAKPPPAVLRRHPHALIDILDPSDAWSAGEFVRAAMCEVERAHELGKIPLLVGGSMLYFHSLLGGLAQMPPADPQFRRRLRQRAQQQGWQVLHAELLRCDPVLGERIHPADVRRIERALEVFALTGRPLSHWQQDSPSGVLSGEEMLLLGLNPPREELHRRIDRRLDAMLAAGFVDEVQALYARGDLHPDLPAIRAIGYRQVWNWLEAGQSEEDFAQVLETIRAASRVYVRRQQNWMRRFQGLIQVTDADGARAALQRCGLI